MNTPRIFLIATFLLIILSEGIYQTITELREGERPLFLDVILDVPSQANLRAYEKSLEDNSKVSQWIQPYIRLLQFAVLKNAGDQVVLGEDGWFFYRPGVQYLIEPYPSRPEPNEMIEDPLVAILDLQAQLNERGIHLIVMPAPNKESIYPDILSFRAERTEQPVYQHTAQFIQRMRNAGIDVIDLFDLYTQSSDEGFYLMQDTHWSTQGMRKAAQSTANKLMDSGLVTKGEAAYSLKEIQLRQYGDLIRMIQIPYIERFYEPEPLQCLQVIDPSTNNPIQSEPNASVLVMGDSFLRIYELDEPGSAGFVSHLAYELQQPITALINDGGASTLVRQELARKPELLRNKKVVIWEFVERDLRFGLGGWPKIALRH